MALAKNITEMKSPTAAKLTQALRDADVISNATQMAELEPLLRPYSDEQAGVLNQMIVAMTSDQGSPNSVPGTLDEADKQAIYDTAVAKLKALKEAGKPKEAGEAAPKGGAKKEPSGPLDAIKGFFKGELGGEVAASTIVGSAVALFNKFNDRDSPASEVTEVATKVALEEGEEIVPRVARTAGRGTKRFLLWLLIGVAILFLLPVVLGPIGLLPGLIIAVVAAIAYTKMKSFGDNNRHIWLHKVGDELPIVMRRTGVTYFDLADKSNKAAFNTVLELLQKNLATKNPFDDTEEQQIDNLLNEMIARISQHYGDVVIADATIDDPDFSIFPPELYEQPMAGHGGVQGGFWV